MKLRCVYWAYHTHWLTRETVLLIFFLWKHSTADRCTHVQHFLYHLSSVLKSFEKKASLVVLQILFQNLEFEHVREDAENNCLHLIINNLENRRSMKQNTENML